MSLPIISSNIAIFIRCFIRYLVVLVGLGLAGCASQSQVHLFAQYLTPQETAKVTELLKAQKYEVVVNKFPFPKNVESNTVIY